MLNFTNEQKDKIRQTLNSIGWTLIEEMLVDELIDGKKVTAFKTEGKTNEEIAREVSAREVAGKTINNLIKRLNNLKVVQIEKKVSYK